MGGPTRLKLVSLGAGAQADTIPNRRQGQRSKVPELSVLSTCAIEVSTPHQPRPKFSGLFPSEIVNISTVIALKFFTKNNRSRFVYLLLIVL